MKPYSKDLRIRVLAAVDRGMPRGEVAETFGVSEPTVRRWLRLRRETGGVDPKRPSGAQGPGAGGGAASTGLAQPRPHARGTPRALLRRARRGGVRLQRQPHP